MSDKKCSLFLLLLCATLLFGAREAKACECQPEPRTVLDEYDHAAEVVIARVAAVKKSGRDAGHAVERIGSSVMTVEQVFKGGVKVGDEMTFRSGDAGECAWPFEEEMVGRRYLLYLGSHEEPTKMRYVSICGRSDNVKRAIDDLLYLNRLDELRGRTRISGKVEFGFNGQMDVGGRVIRITGANEVHEVKTNERGIYEILDLPPGIYLIEADTPAGWKVDGRSRRSYRRNFGVQGEDQSPKKFQIVLEDKTHVFFDVSFEKDAATAVRSGH